jgi:hypothetical protein
MQVTEIDADAVAADESRLEIEEIPRSRRGSESTSWDESR